MSIIKRSRANAVFANIKRDDEKTAYIAIAFASIVSVRDQLKSCDKTIEYAGIGRAIALEVNDLVPIDVTVLSRIARDVYIAYANMSDLVLSDDMDEEYPLLSFFGFPETLSKELMEAVQKRELFNKFYRTFYEIFRGE